jgi:hypothetical protein
VSGCKAYAWRRAGFAAVADVVPHNVAARISDIMHACNNKPAKSGTSQIGLWATLAAHHATAGLDHAACKVVRVNILQGSAIANARPWPAAIVAMRGPMQDREHSKLMTRDIDSARHEGVSFLLRRIDNSTAGNNPGDIE